MVPLADIGVAGEDAGDGGRYLFLPPGDHSPAAEGYLRVASSTFDVHVVLRAIVGSEVSTERVVEYTKQVRAYAYGEWRPATATRYIDAYPERLANAAGLRHELLRAPRSHGRSGAEPGEGRRDDRHAGHHRHPQGRALSARGAFGSRARAGDQGRPPSDGALLRDAGPGHRPVPSRRSLGHRQPHPASGRDLPGRRQAADRRAGRRLLLLDPVRAEAAASRRLQPARAARPLG